MPVSGLDVDALPRDFVDWANTYNDDWDCFCAKIESACNDDNL